MIHVIADIHVVAGRRDDFLREFHALVPQVLAENGCLEYGPTFDAETEIAGQQRREHVVTVVEKWENVAALEAHLAADHMHAYRERVQDMVTDLELRILQPA